MSNNKQSSDHLPDVGKKVKLYTEEEIVSFLKKEFADEINAETFMENLTPIELPSDEEIEQLANDYRSISEFCDIEYFADGAVFAIKWMRDKIQGGNNEQQ